MENRDNSIKGKIKFYSHIAIELIKYEVGRVVEFCKVMWFCVINYDMMRSMYTRITEERQTIDEVVRLLDRMKSSKKPVLYNIELDAMERFKKAALEGKLEKSEKTKTEEPEMFKGV